MKFPIAIEPGDETTAFGVVVPDLPGCFSAGDTLEAAYANAAEAVELWIETALDTGKPIPPPGSLARHQSDPDLAGWTWGMVEVDLFRLDDEAEHVDVILPRRVLRAIDSYAERQGGTKNGFLTRAALDQMRRETASPSGHVASIGRRPKG